MKITKLKDLKAVSEPFLTFSADAGVQHPFLGHTKADELESSDYLFENALQIDVKIKNDGPLDGHEVVQLYIDFPKAADEPPKVLRGFERVHIRSGKAVTASLKLRVKDLSIWYVETCASSTPLR